MMCYVAPRQGPVFQNFVSLGNADYVSKYMYTVFSSPEPLGSQGEFIGWP